MNPSDLVRNPRDKAILKALKLARKAVKLARNPKELAKAKANLKKLMDKSVTQNLKSLGSKVVQGVKDKVTKSNKELTKQLELLKKTKPKAKNKTPTSNKPRVKTRANTNQAPSKAPKQLEMFNKSGTVKAGIKKSNATAAKAAKRKTASEKRKATLQARKDAAKRRADGVAKGKVTKAKNKETKTVTAKTAARKKTRNRLLTGTGLGISAASLVKKPKSKSSAPIKKAKKELTAKEKFLAKRAERKKGTPRDRTLRNEKKRLENRVYGL
jgi:hypothetical protein